MNQRLARSLGTFVCWVLITLGGEQIGTRLGDGEPHTLSDTVTHGPGWPFMAAAAFVAAVAAWQRWHDIGLRRPPRLRHLLLAWLPLLYIAAGLGLAVHLGLPPLRVVGWVLFNTLLVGLSEELMFRGVLMQALRGSVALVPAIALTTLAFGAVHSLNVFITGDLAAALVQSTAAALSGLYFIALRLRSGSLWPCVLVHGLWDCAAFLVAAAGAQNADVAAAPDNAAGLAPVALVLPNALFGLWLLRDLKAWRGLRDGQGPAGPAPQSSGV